MTRRLVALVVEDTGEHVETICAKLEDRHVDAIVARTYDEAIDEIAREEFDFVILDLGLPRHAGDPVEDDLGYEVLDKLRLKWSNREDLFVLVLTGAQDKLKTVKSVLDMKGNAYVARHDVVELQGKLAIAIVEAGKWRDRRGDERLVIPGWREAKVVIGKDRTVHAQTASGKRREAAAPGDTLLEILGKLALDSAGAGVDLDLGGPGTKAKTYSSRLSDWADLVFRCIAGGRAFESRGGRIFAHVKVSLGTDLADRDEFEQRLRRRRRRT
jgi:CheY-like chemotaxis protein